MTEYKSVMQLMVDHFKQAANMHPLQCANEHLRKALIECAAKARSKRQFIQLVRKETGLTKAGIQNNPAASYLLDQIEG